MSDPFWRDRAACLGKPELFFPAASSGAHEAKALCRRCQVRVECLESSLSPFQETGIFAGFGRPTRVKIARQHREGRSLEDLIADADEEFYRRLEAA